MTEEVKKEICKNSIVVFVKKLKNPIKLEIIAT